MCGEDADHKDVATLRVFEPFSAVDYTSPMATLTACQLVDPTSVSPGSILGDDTEHLYQLNHVYVVPPNKGDSIKTADDRLFARLDVWDYSKKISLAFRGKAMLQLASLEATESKEYEERLGTTSFAIHSSPPCACACSRSRKGGKPKLLLQSLARHRETMSSPPLSSKRPHASTLIFPMMRC